MRAALALVLMAAPALADAPASWEAFRDRVAEACLALDAGPGEVAVEVNPFGTESYGVAIVTLTSEAGVDRLACVYSKATGEAEMSAPFAPPG